MLGRNLPLRPTTIMATPRKTPALAARARIRRRFIRKDKEEEEEEEEAAGEAAGSAEEEALTAAAAAVDLTGEDRGGQLAARPSLMAIYV